MEAKIRELIDKIKPNEANFEFMAKAGTINGSLFADLIKIMKEYAKFYHQSQMEKITKYWDDIKQGNPEMYETIKNSTDESQQREATEGKRELLTRFLNHLDSNHCLMIDEGDVYPTIEDFIEIESTPSPSKTKHPPYLAHSLKDREEAWEELEKEEQPTKTDWEGLRERFFDFFCLKEEVIQGRYVVNPHKIFNFFKENAPQVTVSDEEINKMYPDYSPNGKPYFCAEAKRDAAKWVRDKLTK